VLPFTAVTVIRISLPDAVGVSLKSEPTVLLACTEFKTFVGVVIPELFNSCDA
jgi:hypothetical protein